MIARKKSKIKRNTFKLFVVEIHFGPQTMCSLHPPKSIFWPALNKLLFYWNCEQWIFSHYRRQHLRSFHALTSEKGSPTESLHVVISQSCRLLLSGGVSIVQYSVWGVDGLAWLGAHFLEGLLDTAKASSISWRPEWNWGPEPPSPTSLPLPCAWKQLSSCFSCVCMLNMCVWPGGGRARLLTWVSQYQNNFCLQTTFSLQGKDSHTAWPQACDWNLDCGRGSWVGWREEINR